MAVTRNFGNIVGVKVGDAFESRRALSEAGVHRHIQAGISGSQGEVADSIVLSGGYMGPKLYTQEKVEGIVRQESKLPINS